MFSRPSSRQKFSFSPPYIVALKMHGVAFKLWEASFWHYFHSMSQNISEVCSQGKTKYVYLPLNTNLVFAEFELQCSVPIIFDISTQTHGRALIKASLILFDLPLVHFARSTTLQTNCKGPYSHVRKQVGQHWPELVISRLFLSWITDSKVK